MDQPRASLNLELLGRLELIETKVFDLPGATFRRSSAPDPRLSQLRVIAGVPLRDTLTFYQHIATVRDRKENLFFVAFRQTMDALFEDFKDPGKYPEWLMKSKLKQTELKVYIYAVRMQHGQPIFPKNVRVLRTHEDWLEHIPDTMIFHTLAYFLLHQNVIGPDVYGRMA